MIHNIYNYNRSTALISFALCCWKSIQQEIDGSRSIFHFGPISGRPRTLACMEIFDTLFRSNGNTFLTNFFFEHVKN